MYAEWFEDMPIIINGETIKQRMDDHTVHLLQSGYKISFW